MIYDLTIFNDIYTLFVHYFLEMLENNVRIKISSKLIQSLNH